MCDYCEQFKWFQSDKIDCGVLGQLSLDMDICEDREGIAEESIALFQTFDGEIEEIYQYEIPIHYCPICGRKLEEKDENRS